MTKLSIKPHRKSTYAAVLVSILASGLMSSCMVSEAPIQPGATNPTLAQALATYLEPDFGNDLTVDYELYELLGIFQPRWE
jgi:hypothetical protein